MNIEMKQQNSGLFPTYLNFTTSSTKFQEQDDITAKLNDFSSCNTTFIIEHKPEPVKQYVKYQ